MQSTGKKISAVVEATLSSEIDPLKMMRHFKNPDDHSSGQFASFSIFPAIPIVIPYGYHKKNSNNNNNVSAP
jgi:hypothetical protein